MTVRVLLADDAADLRFLLTQALSLDGRLEVVAAVGDGRAALEAIAAHLPDVVLMDVAMPVMDGLTATREVKARWPQLPVIIFTGYADAVVAAGAEEVGADAFVGKDRPLAEVVDTLLAHSA